MLRIIKQFTPQNAKPYLDHCTYNDASKKLVITSSNLNGNHWDGGFHVFNDKFEMEKSVPMKFAASSSTWLNPDTIVLGKDNGYLQTINIGSECLFKSLSEISHDDLVRDVIKINDYLVSGCNHGDLFIWNTELARVNEKRTAHCGPILSLTSDAAAEYFASSSKDGTICIWDVRSFSFIKRFPVKNYCNCLVMLEDYALLLGDCAGNIILKDLRNFDTIDFCIEDYPITTLSVRGDGKFLCCGTAGGNISVYSASPTIELLIMSEFNHKDIISDSTWISDTIFTTVGYDDQLTVWEMKP